MYRFHLLLCFLLMSSYGISQVTFLIESIPENTPSEDFVFLAGNINNWDPGEEIYKLHKNADGLWQLDLEAQDEGFTLEFKFTRGDWGTVEKDENGAEMANRQFTFGNGQVVSFQIANWADGGSGGGQSTAAENVSIMSESFHMPQLNRDRRIWIYLPPDYEQSNNYYPVIYMQDGQNLFDQFTSFSGEWEVDETLNELAQDGMNVPIIIGIDNGGAHRMDEYSAWLNIQYGGGEGYLYMQFISETLKPWVDEHYRTLSDENNTALMGSSLGAFIAHYGVFEFPNIFSKAGIFSPSYWYSDSVWSYTEENAQSQGKRLYQIVGSEEGYSMVHDMEMMHDHLLSYGFTNLSLKSQVVEGAGHNESFWRSEFKAAYLWMFSEFANGIQQEQSNQILDLFPNPVKNELYISIDKIDSLKIYNIEGVIVLDLHKDISNKVDLSHLKSGMYFVCLASGTKRYSEKIIKL